MSPIERPIPQRVQHGCPKDQGDLLYDAIITAYTCEVCGYMQKGPSPPVDSLITLAPPRPPSTTVDQRTTSASAVEGPTVVELMARWGLASPNGAALRIRDLAHLEYLPRTRDRIAPSLVAQVEAEYAKRHPETRALVPSTPSTANGTADRPSVPRVKATPRPLPVPAPTVDHVERRLANGTVVTVTVVGSMLTLSRLDREWLYDLIDAVDVGPTP